MDIRFYLLLEGGVIDTMAHRDIDNVYNGVNPDSSVTHSS